jgi:protein TonB
MQAPSQGLRPISPPVSNSGRVISIILAVVLNLGIIYALYTGLAARAVKVLVQNIDVAVIEPPADEEKPPPPPPPTVKEPPPFVPPPDIVIDAPAAPTTTAIQTTTSVAPPAPAPPAPAPVSSAPKPINSHAVTARDYPPISVRLNEQGKVGVRYLVSADGNVTEVQITSSSGKQRLDDAAVVLVKKWRFHPALAEGKPVPAWVAAQVVFRLQ